MRKVKFNQQTSLINNTAIGVILSTGIIIALSLSSYAGPQSLLDPYADIPAPAAKPVAKTLFAKKTAKKQSSDTEGSPMRTNEEDNVSSELPPKSIKVKTLAISKNSSSAEASVAKSNSSNNPGFISGVKEIQHGCIISIKAVGGGIINGGKSAGAKVQGLYSGGDAVAHHTATHARKKVVAKKEIAPLDARRSLSSEPNLLPTTRNFPVLPGKPLDQAIAEKKIQSKVKDKPLTDEVVKPSRLTQALSKLNFFNKPKKVVQPAPRVAATNTAGVAQ